jgi:hypothetical protein
VRHVPFRYGAITTLLVLVSVLTVVVDYTPLWARLLLCCLVPVLALLFDWRFVQSELRALAARRKR